METKTRNRALRWGLVSGMVVAYLVGWSVQPNPVAAEADGCIVPVDPVCLARTATTPIVILVPDPPTPTPTPRGHH
jgi:hypothetical protein